MHEIKCVICGKGRIVSPYFTQAKYCSRACFHASQRKRVEVTCATCGKSFVTSPTRRAKGNGKYCSRQCCAAAKVKKDAIKQNYAYDSWRGMMRRCLDRGYHSYANYGGRGISVCSAWRQSFDQFLADMGPRPHGQTLDRIDPDGFIRQTIADGRHRSRNHEISEIRSWSSAAMDECLWPHTRTCVASDMPRYSAGLKAAHRHKMRLTT